MLPIRPLFGALFPQTGFQDFDRDGSHGHALAEDRVIDAVCISQDQQALRPLWHLFESMLNGEAELTPTARDQVLDWWATAIDRYVRILPAVERAAAYDHLIAHMESELRRDSGSGAAAYWLAAAAFARGQVERAWHAAISGWVRALLTADRGAALRPDLDRLMREAIIPERVRRLPIAGTPEAEQAQAGMLAEWDLVKEKWTQK